MKPMKLKKENKTIILFEVTDIMGGEEAVYSYHIIDEEKKITSLGMEQIRKYTFIGFVEDKEVPTI